MKPKNKDLNKIVYQENPPLQNIDIKRLRPNKSYEFLIKNRNGDLQKTLDQPEILNQFLVNRDCPLCRSNNYSLEIKKDGLKIVKCKKCELIYVNPVFDEAQYRKIYKSKSYQDIGKQLSIKSHEYRVQRFGEERAEFISANHQEPLSKTYLDIGCSTGFTLESLSKRGWVCKGLELNPATAEFARRRGLNVQEKDFLDLSDQENFSAISLFDVLEHLYDPTKILEKAYKVLNKGGSIYIYVPNWNSASKDLLGEARSHFVWPTHHLTYYTPSTLIKHIEKIGFSTFHWETQGLDLFDWAWADKERLGSSSEYLMTKLDLIQSYINASGHGKNLRLFARKL